MVVRTALTRDFSGSSDSAAAMATTSMPPKDRRADEGVAGEKPEDEQCADDKESNDDGDLDEGEPVLELAEQTNAQKVDGAEESHADGCRNPGRAAKPRADESGGAGDFRAKDRDGGEPINPALRKSCPAANAVLRVFGEGAGCGDDRAHLTEHLHDQDGKETSDEISQKDRGASGRNANTGA